MPPRPLAPQRQGASLGVLGSGGKVWWCTRRLVNLDRHGLNTITTSSLVSAFHGVTSETLVLCNYRSRLQMFERVWVRHFALFFDVGIFAEERDAGCCLRNLLHREEAWLMFASDLLTEVDSVGFHQHQNSTFPTH